LHFIFGADAGVSGLSLDFRGARVRGEIQLLLTDVIMPKLRGPELAARLRMRYPSLKSDLYVWLHGERVGAGRNARAKHRATAEAVYGETDFAVRPTIECHGGTLAGQPRIPSFRYACFAGLRRDW